MAVEKRLEESEIELMDPDNPAQKVEVAVVNPEAVAISTEDGGVVIDLVLKAKPLLRVVMMQT